MLNANTYVTQEPGIGGSIRNSYEDFYVEEIPEITPQGEGPNVWIWIEKVGRTTLDVLLDISRDLHISRKRMGFAGMKDKKALTRQWICISNMDSESQLEEIINLEDNIRNTKFLKVVRGQKKLRMGQLIGNKFKIIIKDIPFNDDIKSLEDAVIRAREILKQLEHTGVPNYFGWQRFGKPRSTTHLVGEALIQNDLKKAVDTYIGHPTDKESPETYKARVAYDENNLKESLNLMHGAMRYEKMMLKELIKDLDKYGQLNDESYKKALHALPKPLSRMFVHAYQSYLFNEVVSKRVEMGINKYIEGDIIIDNEEKIIRGKTNQEYQNLINNFQAHPTSPLYGTKVPFAEGKVGEMEKDLLDKYSLTKEDFEVEKMPKLGSHGLRRSMRFKIWNSNVKVLDDRIMVEFSINKGSYATTVLREIMKEDVI